MTSPFGMVILESDSDASFSFGINDLGSSSEHFELHIDISSVNSVNSDILMSDCNVTVRLGDLNTPPARFISPISRSG